MWHKIWCRYRKVGTLASRCSSKSGREWGGIDFFLVFFCVLCTLSSRKRGLCLCCWRAPIPHIWGENPQLLLTTSPTQFSGLLAPPAAPWKWEVKTEMLFMCFAAPHHFTSIYFSPKNPSGVQAISAGDITQPRFGEQQDIHSFPPSRGAPVKSLLGEIMYPLTWNIHQNVQMRIPQLTSH